VGRVDPLLVPLVRAQECRPRFLSLLVEYYTSMPEVWVVQEVAPREVPVVPEDLMEAAQEALRSLRIPNAAAEVVEVPLIFALVVLLLPTESLWPLVVVEQGEPAETVITMEEQEVTGLTRQEPMGELVSMEVAQEVVEHHRLRVELLAVTEAIAAPQAPRRWVETEDPALTAVMPVAVVVVVVVTSAVVAAPDRHRLRVETAVAVVRALQVQVHQV
jgi:hypothetical protein